MHFFRKKFHHICISLDVNFNESLTNDVVSFGQLGPDVETILSYRVGGVSLKRKVYGWTDNDYIRVLMTRQPLWVILCGLPERGRKEIEEIVQELQERDREEIGTGMKVKKQKK